MQYGHSKDSGTFGVSRIPAAMDSNAARVAVAANSMPHTTVVGSDELHVGVGADDMLDSVSDASETLPTPLPEPAAENAVASDDKVDRAVVLMNIKAAVRLVHALLP